MRQGRVGTPKIALRLARGSDLRDPQLKRVDCLIDMHRDQRLAMDVGQPDRLFEQSPD